jgi:hypothetical protein
MFADEDPSAFNARIEALTEALEASPREETRACARELVGLVLDFHGAAMRRILAIAADEAPGLTERLRMDPLVASLLALHEQPVAPPAVHAHGEEESVCALCGATLADAHHHRVDIVSRRLSCTCRACWLLSGTRQGPGSYRAVPDRYVAGPALRLDAALWDALQVPVDIAFFMFNSAVGRTMAFYPSPAGATESALTLEAWRDVEQANPWVRAAAPDVEALLVRRARSDRGEWEGYIVPIDACYDLVGRIRLQWTGFSGGAGVQAQVDRFFTDAAAKSAGAVSTLVDRR